MLRVEYTSQFKRDFKKVTRMSIEDILVVGHVISQLQQNEPLSAKFVDHPLSGNWNGFRDCHIKPDLVLIYRVNADILQLARIGSHSELF